MEEEGKTEKKFNGKINGFQSIPGDGASGEKQKQTDVYILL